MRNHSHLFLVLVFLATTPACDDLAAGGDTVVDLHADDVRSPHADVYNIEPGGVCQPTSRTGLIEADMPGVQVVGTGHLGPESIRVEIFADVEVEFFAGTYFEPKPVENSQVVVKRPQKMMIAADVLLQGPGTFFIDANCMEYQQATPDEYSEFYSCTQEPTTPVQLCQRDCGDSQGCIWACDGVPESVTQVDIDLYVTDDCDDNYPLVYRFFDRTSGQVWPEVGVYETEGVGIKTVTEFTCTIGNKICLGGETNGNIIGVGLDGSGADGEDWCLQCGMSHLTGWGLGCG